MSDKNIGKLLTRRLGGVKDAYPRIPFCDQEGSNFFYRLVHPLYFFKRGTAVPSTKFDVEIHPFKHLLSSRMKDLTPKQSLIWMAYNEEMKKRIKQDLSGLKVCQKKLPNSKYAIAYQIPHRLGKITDSATFMRCRPTQWGKAWKQLYEESSDHYFKLLQAATVDWPFVETTTAPIMNQIKKAFPSVASTDEDSLRYLMKIIFAGQETGMSDYKLLNIVDDVSAVSRNIDEFNGALQAIVCLVFAKSLHVNHRDKHGGSGVSSDFELFVDGIVAQIRNGRVRFRVASPGQHYAIAHYNSKTNTMTFPPPHPDGDVLSGVELFVHEMYHAWQDMKKRRQTFVNAEVEAYERGIKTGLLFKQWMGNTFRGVIYNKIEQLRNNMKADELNDKLDEMKCEGHNDKEIERYRAWRTRRDASFVYAANEFSAELYFGIPADSARRRIRQREIDTAIHSIRNRANREKEILSWLYEFDAILPLQFRERGSHNEQIRTDAILQTSPIKGTIASSERAYEVTLLILNSAAFLNAAYYLDLTMQRNNARSRHKDHSDKFAFWHKALKQYHEQLYPLLRQEVISQPNHADGL